MFSARARGGVIVPEDGVTLPEGTIVTVIADFEAGAFETAPEEERELLDAVAGVERGEVITAAGLLERLRR